MNNPQWRISFFLRLILVLTIRHCYIYDDVESVLLSHKSKRITIVAFWPMRLFFPCCQLMLTIANKGEELQNQSLDKPYMFVFLFRFYSLVICKNKSKYAPPPINFFVFGFLRMSSLNSRQNR